MAVGLSKASVFAAKIENVIGTYAPPTVGQDFLSLRPKNELSFEPEILTSDELLNDIGEAKGSIGKLSVKGSHSSYLRNSGVGAWDVEYHTMLLSLFGSYNQVNDTALVSGSTTTVLKVTTGLGVNFSVGQPVLIKDLANGYSIRNVASISGDDLTLNFALSAAPATGVVISDSKLYAPVAQNHPTFSVTKYIGNGHAIEASAGNTTTDMTIKADANKFAEIDFSYEGTNYYYNSIKIEATNKYIDFIDDQGTQVATLVEGIYATPVDLATAIQNALDAASTETMTCIYDNVAGMFTIASGSTLFTLKFSTGANVANSIASTIGFPANDLTGSQSYTSATELDYVSPITPIYNLGDLIVMKGSELFIGNQNDTMCICAQTVSLKVAKKVEDVDCICSSTGILQKIPTSRTAELTVTSVLKKHDAALLSALLNNSNVSAMLNCGTKNAGNWVRYNCANFYLMSATVSSFKTSGDNFVTAEITLKGFVTDSAKDIYLGFV